jgi:hypothetical protein
LAPWGQEIINHSKPVEKMQNIAPRINVEQLVEQLGSPKDPNKKVKPLFS